MSNDSIAAPVRATKGQVRAKATTAAPAPTPAEATPPAGAAGVAESGSLIVLTLRPNGAKFNGNRVERAGEAGFAWIPKDASFMGFLSPDTGEEIARLVVNKSEETFGRLKEIQVHVDPATCAYHWSAGEKLMRMVKRYAILIGAYVADGMGRALAEDELQAIFDHIDAVMVQRRDADRAARIVTLPCGERRELSELSFIYNVLREAGEKKKCFRPVYFDAPPLHYHEGRAKGMEMAGEIVAFYLRHKQEGLRLDHILREALQAPGNWFGDYRKADVNNVTAGFMDVVSTLIEVGARSLNPRWLRQRIEREKIQHELWLQDRARVVEQRLRGREAAKARRAAAGKEGGTA